MDVTYNALRQQNYPMKLAQKLTKKCAIASRTQGQSFSLSLGLVCELLGLEQLGFLQPYGCRVSLLTTTRFSEREGTPQRGKKSLGFKKSIQVRELKDLDFSRLPRQQFISPMQQVMTSAFNGWVNGVKKRIS
jgi:hypothetical protein